MTECNGRVLNNFEDTINRWRCSPSTSPIREKGITYYSRISSKEQRILRRMPGLYLAGTDPTLSELRASMEPAPVLEP